MKPVRKASQSDVPAIVAYIGKKAAFDRELGCFEGTLGASVDRIAKAMFGVPALAHAFLISFERRTAGFAFYHFQFSASEGRPSLWLEDLYIDEGARRSGCGVALMGAVAGEAVLRECTRLEWAVDDRNQAGLAFCAKLGVPVASHQDHRVVYSIAPASLAARLGGFEQPRQTRPPMAVGGEASGAAAPVKFSVPRGASTYKTLVGADTYRDGGSIEARFACADGSFETVWLQASLDPEFGVRYIHTDLLIFADVNRQGPSCRIAKNSAEEEAVVIAIHQFLRLPNVAVPFSHRTPDEHYLTTVEALLAGIPDRIPTGEGTSRQI